MQTENGRDNGTVSSTIGHPSAMPEAGAVANATASVTFVRETIAHLHQMMEWTASVVWVLSKRNM